jgi:integrase
MTVDDGGKKKHPTKRTGIQCDEPTKDENGKGRRSNIGGKGSREAMRALKAWRDAYVKALTEREEDEAAEADVVTKVAKMHTREFMTYYWGTRNVSVATMDGYKNLGRHLAHKTLDKPIGELRPGDVQAWVDAKRDGDLSGRMPTLVKALKQLKYGLRWAVRMEYIDRNAAEPVQIPKTRAPKPNPLVDDDARESLIEALDAMRNNGTDAQRQLADAAAVAMYEGLRIGEVCGLRWCDIDGGADGSISDSGSIHVNRTISETSDGPMIKDYPKSERRRDIPMSKRVASILKQRRDTFNQQKRVGEKYVFAIPSKSASYPRAFTIEKAWRALATLLNLEGAEGKPLRFHDLRHTFATRATIKGVDDVSIAGVMGHEDTATTKRIYDRWTNASKRRAVEAAE